jgi:phosphoribosylamine--glycine ligase
MGDPETQPIMMRLKSDLVEVLLHATDGTLDQVELKWDRRTALGVVMAAAGYPEPAQGRRHHRPAGRPRPTTPWSSTPAPRAGRQLLTSGGRVLCVTALGDSVKQAQQRAYEVARHPFRRRAVPHRHRPPRHQALRPVPSPVVSSRRAFS